MTNIGLPVPQGFTITTEACTQYYADGRKISDEIQAQIMEYIVKMEEITGKKFGDLENPLLVSVRSGARASMPGMMDTILNLGLNEEVVEVMAKKSGNPRWAYDCYRRFIQMYSDVVMEVGKKHFEQLIDEMKERKGVTQDVDLTAEDLKELAGQFKAEYKAKIGVDFPTDPKEQLMGGGEGGVPVLGQSPGRHLPPGQRHPLFLGHGSQCPADGFWQHGRRLRHRRGLHPEPVHGGEEAHGRVFNQRPGRGRGGRRPHPHAH